LLEHGSVGGVFYFAMEYCAGGTFEDLRRRRGGRVHPAEASGLMLQVLDGLSYAHAKGFVHRDLKPHNMLLTDGTPAVAKVSDFGLAKNFEQAGFSGFTATGAVVAGTFAFMAREQLIDFRFVKPVSDVWSAAATLYFLVTAYFPRDFGPGEDEMEIILRGGVVPILERNPAIPVRLAQVIDRALADDLAHRFDSAAAFSAALKEAL
jgi:serine/threonine protein kinase